MSEKSVLIVDDDAVIRLAYTKVFARTGYAVRGAEHAEEALALMAAAPAGVLILDLNLPTLDGVELCLEIRRRWPSCILIAVTGYASVFELVRCREVGFDDYFIKPVGTRELLAAVQNAFQKMDRWKTLRG